jgi:hypothetical protein
MTDEKLKALAEKTPKDFGPNDDTWRYIEAVGPEVVLKLLARIAALRSAATKALVYAPSDWATHHVLNDALKADDEAQND